MGMVAVRILPVNGNFRGSIKIFRTTCRLKEPSLTKGKQTIGFTGRIHPAADGEWVRVSPSLTYGASHQTMHFLWILLPLKEVG
jgi:hypothetical protein